MRRIAGQAAPALAVLLVAAVASLSTWLDPVPWRSDPDTLYYQAKTLSFRGQDERAALHRLVRGPLARELRRGDRQAMRRDPTRKPQFTSLQWIDYSSRFFERRVWVSLMAAAIYPIAGVRSVLTVSLIGYLLLSLALYALLRRRFSTPTSVLVASAGILLWPVRDSSFVPMTDSWGLLLETCALLAAVLYFDRGSRWLVAWVAVLVMLSFTRDNWVVALVAAGCLFLQQRERRSALLLGTGAAAVLPALALLGNTSIRGNLAFVFSGYYPPGDTSWKFVLHEWPRALRHLVEDDLHYGDSLTGAGGALWVVFLLALAVGLVLLLRSLRDTDPYFRLLSYSLLGAAVYVALFADYSGLRQEIAFLPGVAVCLALLFETAWRRWAARRPAAVDAGAADGPTSLARVSPPPG